MIGSFGDVVKEGWLEKQSKFLKSWRKRWFVLTQTHIYTFKHERVYSNPTEQLVLKFCTTVKSAEQELGKANTFRIDSPERVFYCRAPSMQEKELWIGAIGKVMIQPSIKPPSSEEEGDEEESITEEEDNEEK